MVRHYSTFNISNIANTVTKTKSPSTLTGRNVRLSYLLISSCFIPYLHLTPLGTRRRFGTKKLEWCGYRLV